MAPVASGALLADAAQVELVEGLDKIGAGDAEGVGVTKVGTEAAVVSGTDPVALTVVHAFLLQDDGVCGPLAARDRRQELRYEVGLHLGLIHLDSDDGGHQLPPIVDIVRVPHAIDVALTTGGGLVPWGV